jgi:hypothetical protein
LPRTRYLKPDFFDDVALCELKPLARLLFAGLWCWADREGRLVDEPVRFKKNILGYDSCNVPALLDDLMATGHIVRYESGGRRFIWVRNFKKHQHPHNKELPSTLPAPIQDVPSTDLGAVSTPTQHAPRKTAMGNGEWGMIDEQQERQPDSPAAAAAVRTVGNDPEFARVIKALETWIGINPTMVDRVDAELERGTPPDWLIAAFKKAALANSKSWNYAQIIIDDWRDNGYDPDRKKTDPAVAKYEAELAAVRKAAAV